ncbi:hypothetical protein LGZ99_18965 [Photorhabdus temperata]|uniref:Uncharacterized protein n=1 Tax=Photorhabdus temperata subsp. temperata Meg1 TaxID=1393735 RepID=A0A081RZ43_PHOTE|nr:hypothetical protein [Photorhabdus temperata]KER03946.1 hypothetical protein MEG1DRAFT_01360 [Photorhabdus temperata subsp. temperata Meg1]MCT8349212.1 hypothetical protein [Photorhabdus temperata]
MTDQNNSDEIVSSNVLISDVTVSSIEIAPEIARDNAHVQVTDGEGKTKDFLLDRSDGGYQGYGSLISLVLAHLSSKKVNIRTTGYIYKDYGYINGVSFKTDKPKPDPKT